MTQPPPPGERIAKILSRAGIASRRDAEKMIEAGRVRVNGREIASPALNVTGADVIEVDGKPIAAPEAPRLWIYHKPAGLVTSARDEKGRQTVFDALPEEMPRVMSVGRLDLTSEGLLLLTNDGGLKRKMELPSTGWLRRYRVRVHGTPKDEDFAPLRAGIEVEGVRYQPMEVSLDRQVGRNAWVSIGLREGKNREIRRVMEAIGMPVSRLIRISYGPFQLGKLGVGEVEELRPRVVEEQLGLGDGARPQRLRRKPGGAAPKGKMQDGKAAGRKPAGGQTASGRPRSAAKSGGKDAARPGSKGPARAPRGKPAPRRKT